MSCNDCPNQIDGKCCHQSIKPKGTAMNKLDDLAWEREFKHVESKQKQTHTVTFAGGQSYEVPEAIYSNEIKENNNEK